MRRCLPLILSALALLGLVGCDDELSDVRAPADMVLMCADKGKEYKDEFWMKVIPPKFLLNTDTGSCGATDGLCTYNVEFTRVGDMWCLIKDPSYNKNSFTMSLEPKNQPASEIEELMLWYAAEGSDIRQVVETTPQRRLDGNLGVFRLAVLEQTDAPIMILTKDHALIDPDI